MLTALPTVSQNTLTTEKSTNRVQTYVTEQGDTMVIMTYEDARMLLQDVLYYEYTDSLLTEYKAKDILNEGKITLQKDFIDNLNKENLNLKQMNTNLKEVIKNKDEELGYNADTIKQQKKEIRKQKRLKILGFVGTVVVPIVVIILLI